MLKCILHTHSLYAVDFCWPTGERKQLDIPPGGKAQLHCKNGYMRSDLSPITAVQIYHTPPYPIKGQIIDRNLWHIFRIGGSQKWGILPNAKNQLKFVLFAKKIVKKGIEKYQIKKALKVKNVRIVVIIFCENFSNVWPILASFWSIFFFAFWWCQSCSINSCHLLILVGIFEASLLILIDIASTKCCMIAK